MAFPEVPERLRKEEYLFEKVKSVFEEEYPIIPITDLETRRARMVERARAWLETTARFSEEVIGNGNLNITPQEIVRPSGQEESQ